MSERATVLVARQLGQKTGRTALDCIGPTETRVCLVWIFASSFCSLFSLSLVALAQLLASLCGAAKRATTIGASVRRSFRKPPLSFG